MQYMKQNTHYNKNKRMLTHSLFLLINISVVSFVAEAVRNVGQILYQFKNITK